MAITRNINDPSIPKNVSGYSAPAPADKTTAAAIETVGNQAIAAFTGYEKAGLHKEVNREIGNFFARREAEAAGAIDQKVSEVSQTADEVAADGLTPEEKIQVDNAAKDLSRTAEILRQGAGSQLELKARIEAKTKEYINRMPGLANEFRAVASRELNDYASRIALVENRRLQEQKAAEEQNKYLETVAKFHGIPISAVTQKSIADFQQFKLAENRADFADNITTSEQFDTSQKLNAVDQAAASRKVMGMFQLNNAIRGFKVGGKSIAERLKEGQSYSSITTDLFRNESDLMAFKDNMKQGLDTLKRQVSTYYAQKQASLGLPPKMVDENLKAQLSTLDSISNSIETITDAKRLAKFVENMNKYEGGLAAGFAISHPGFAISKQNGMISPNTWDQFIENPANLKANAPELFKVMTQVAGDSSMANRYISLHNHFLINPEDFNSNIMSSDPQMKKLLGTTATKGYEQILLQGFDNGDKDQLENSFVNYGRLILTQVKNDDPNSLKAFERYFTDPKFMTRLEQLPPEKRGELLQPVSESAINTIAGPNGLVDRLGMEEIPAGGFLYYNKMSGKLEVTGVREGLFSSSSAKVIREDVDKLDRYLKLLWKSKEMSGQTAEPYGDFVSGFVSKVKEMEDQ